jgi:hypothetical protein
MQQMANKKDASRIDASLSLFYHGFTVRTRKGGSQLARCRMEYGVYISD